MDTLDARKALLAEKLRKAREDLETSKKDMAKVIGISYSSYKEYESQKIFPPLGRLEIIIKWIDCTEEEKKTLRGENKEPPIETSKDIKSKDKDEKPVFPLPEDWTTIDVEDWREIVNQLRGHGYSEKAIAEMAGLSSPNSVRNIWRHKKGQAGATRKKLLESLQEHFPITAEKHIIQHIIQSIAAESETTETNGMISLPLSGMIKLIANPLMDFVKTSTLEERVLLRQTVGNDLDDLLAGIRGLFSEKSRDQMLSERKRGDKSYYRKDVNDNDK